MLLSSKCELFSNLSSQQHIIHSSVLPKPLSFYHQPLLFQILSTFISHKIDANLSNINNDWSQDTLEGNMYLINGLISPKEEGKYQYTEK